MYKNLIELHDEIAQKIRESRRWNNKACKIYKVLNIIIFMYLVVLWGIVIYDIIKQILCSW